MSVHMYSCVLVGVEGVLLEVEASVSAEQEAFTLLGFPPAEVDGMQARVRTALIKSGFSFPSSQITISLAPTIVLYAENAAACDLLLAIAMLSISGQISSHEEVEAALFLGTLAPDGRICSVPGILPMVELAREKGFNAIFLPEANVVEASMVEGVTLYPVTRLEQLVAHLTHERPLPSYAQGRQAFMQHSMEALALYDMAAVRGHEHVKRALEIAASGGHSILLCGAPGAGKSLLARTFPSLLPPISSAEVLESSRIYSVSGLLSHTVPLMLQRPIRTPPPTISATELLGGTDWPPRPGEVSLAHRGVIFLEDLSFYAVDTLAALSKVLSAKRVTVEHDGREIVYPADAQLIATMRPCPCGFLNDFIVACSCSTAAIAQYQQRLQVVLSACFDLTIEVPRIAHEQLASKRVVETSASIRTRVLAARRRQWQRFQGSALTCNADLQSNEVGEFCRINASGSKLLAAATERLSLSDHVTFRVVRLARTIADMADCDEIAANHIAEALHYRTRTVF